MPDKNSHLPEILAPAGNRPSFFAALEAGADAIYCGLKAFSARMTADNFTVPELARLADMARSRGTRLYLAFNTMMKESDLASAGRLLEQSAILVKPDAIIVQDIGMFGIARQCGFTGEIHLSTLSNVTYPSAVNFIRENLPADRIVLPREISLDEIRLISRAAGEHPALEVFVHGALCYAVSGRCYWSSYLGGKSGLRGKCVQPCRRQYSFNETSGRYFSCLDLGLEEQSASLLSIKNIKGWKIEGRKKGPHYVYHTVLAYRTLRDHPGDAGAVQEARSLLEAALGRQTTRYNFSPQKPQNPVSGLREAGSGKIVGKINNEKGKTYFIAREELHRGDLLRLGYEEDTGHSLQKMGMNIAPQQRFELKLKGDRLPRSGTPVFLIDRREGSLSDSLARFDSEFDSLPEPYDIEAHFEYTPPHRNRERMRPLHIELKRIEGVSSADRQPARWLTYQNLKSLTDEQSVKSWWFLPPVIWPSENRNYENLVKAALDKGARFFMLNAPWQAGLFPDPSSCGLWAGPFCNIANGEALRRLADMGFSGAVASPELGGNDLLSLPESSPLPLGIVVEANWPLCVARALSEQMTPGHSFSSGKGEEAWAEKHEGLVWIFPNWKLDITRKQEQLLSAGYGLFLHIFENASEHIPMKTRPGLWNWDIGLS